MSDDWRNLRIAKSRGLAEYFANTNLWRKVGNATFADMIRSGSLTPPSRSQFSKAYVLYHSWLPGFIDLPAGAGRAFWEFRRNPTARSVRGIFPPNATAFMELAGWLERGEPDLAILMNKMKIFVAIQNRYELKSFLKVVQAQKPNTVLEIGSARGGMLYHFAQLAAPEAKIISIDLPGAPNCGGQTESERELFSTFLAPRQSLHFISKNSLWNSTREELRALLGKRKVDLMFIDGDHSYGGVSSDFRMYKEFLARDGILAFHDTCLTPDRWGPGNEVGIFWNEIRKRYKTREIVDPKGYTGLDKPRTAEWAWGIGIILPGQRLSSG